VLPDGPDDPASAGFGPMLNRIGLGQISPMRTFRPSYGVMVSGEHPNATAYRQTADASRSGDQPARLWSMST
jgi:hypothetical protein